MLARKLEPGELWRSRLNMAVAFEGCFDMAAEREKAKTDQADPAEDHWGAFPEGETEPVSSFVMNLYDVRFDGHTVKMGGVGGVATLPAHRRGGGVRACMKAAFRDLYDRGFAFSALYPFSTAFYRQFGFENGEPCRLWEVPLKDLPKADVGGKVRQLFPGDDLSPLLDVYDQMYGSVNLSVVRKAYDKALEKDNFFDQKRWIFLWEDEAGRPGAFLIGGRDGETLNCRTDFSARNGLLFRDARSLTGLLSFVRGAFLSNFETLRFGVPGYLDLSNLIPEVAGAGGNSYFNGMVRAVNAELVLKLCRCEGEGTAVLRVSDPMLPENNDAFRLTFAPDRENRVERVKDEPDVSLSVGELGQLLCGVKTWRDLPWMPGVEVRGTAGALRRIFYHKPCHILDLF